MRHALPAPGTLTIMDVSAGGLWLATSDDQPLRIMVRPPGASEDRDVSWLDCSLNERISGDGRSLIFTDQSAGAGRNYMVGFRRTTDRRWFILEKVGPRAVTRRRLGARNSVEQSGQVDAVPDRSGRARRIDRGELKTYNEASWMGDGKSLFVCGNEAGQASRCYVRPVDGGELRPVTPEGIIAGIVSPDGTRAVVQRASGSYLLCSLKGEGEDPRPLQFLEADDQLIRWSPDGKRIWIYKKNKIPTQVDQLDPETGRRELLIEVGPREKVGVQSIISISMSDDPMVYAYTAWEYSSRLSSSRERSDPGVARVLLLSKAEAYNECRWVYPCCV